MEYITYLVTKTNKIIMNVIARPENSLYVKDKIIIKKEKSTILKEPGGIKKNLSTEEYSECNR